MKRFGLVVSPSRSGSIPVVGAGKASLSMKLSFAALLAFSSPAFAQTTGQVAPDAGSILRQVQPGKTPGASSSAPELTIERGEGPVKLAPTAAFPVKIILITGNTQFDTPILRALVAEGEGKTLDLAQLSKLANRITEFYRNNGYPLARAIIPAQTIYAGVVRFEVIEARYGKIALKNDSRVKDAVTGEALSSLKSGQVIGQKDMDHALLMLSDIPGVVVAATLKPGAEVGTSDLMVNATAGPPLSGSVTLDNHGNRYTGSPRLGANLNYNNPLHFGDVLSLSALSSGGGMNYARMGYESMLNGLGTRLGGSYSALHYALGEPLASLDASGNARVASLWTRQPFIRSRDFNLYGQIQYDGLRLRDHIDQTGIRTDRHLGNWTFNLSGDGRDGLLSGGVNTWNLGWTTGKVAFDDAAAQTADAAAGKTQGRFSKWNVNLARTQRLTQKAAFYFAASAQFTNDNLDSSQKMSAGGPYSVRAYGGGVLSGDVGYQGNVEFRYDLSGQFQAVAFYDSAHVTINKNPWVAGQNGDTLSGAGVGLNWSGLDQWSFTSYVAAPVGTAPELAGTTKSVLGWVEIGKRF